MRRGMLWGVALPWLVSGCVGQNLQWVDPTDTAATDDTRVETTTTPTTPTSDTDAMTSTPTSSSGGETTTASGVCGNGVTEQDEQCDDGNDDDTDECVSGCVLATCGDGFVRLGVEECDDGNDSDKDACVSGCVMATCGDGFVWAGVEGCDDQNNNNDDACTNECLSPGCGDGVVDALEECDEGMANANNGECTTLCTLNVCGDGLQWDGVEECDDGNVVNTDSCTVLCKPPSCQDQLLSGAETDVDCGGPCPGCPLGDACFGTDDCAGGVCVNGLCTAAAHCADALMLDPQADTGLYQIDPDGMGGAEPFPAYCDMDTFGGGWTLVLKADGQLMTFTYHSPLWTNNVLVNENNPTFDHEEGKLRGWLNVPVMQIMIGLEHPINENQNPPAMKYAILQVEGSSMYSIMAPDTFIPTALGREAWKELIPGSSLQLHCNLEGLNNNPADNAMYHAVRFGIIANGEENCGSCDSRLGIGGRGTGCTNLDNPTGNYASCGQADNGDVDLISYGAVFVR